ncbi:MAG TPA: glycosyltransferase, partial [Phycisphaerae bacterium]
ICEGYNRGIALAKGDHLLLSHDDVEFLEDSFAPNLMHHLQTFDLIGIAGSTRCTGGGWGDARPPYLLGQLAQAQNNFFSVMFFGVYPQAWEAQMLDGVFMACHRRVAQEIGFDAASFPRWHGYDSDFSYSAHLRGFRVGVASDLFAIHHSWGTYDDDWGRARAKFVEKHRIHARPLAPGRLAASIATDKPQALRLMKDALEISARKMPLKLPA